MHHFLPVACSMDLQQILTQDLRTCCKGKSLSGLGHKTDDLFYMTEGIVPVIVTAHCQREVVFHPFPRPLLWPWCVTQSQWLLGELIYSLIKQNKPFTELWFDWLWCWGVFHPLSIPPLSSSNVFLRDRCQVACNKTSTSSIFFTWRSISIGIRWTWGQKMKNSVFLIWCACQIFSLCCERFT